MLLIIRMLSLWSVRQTGSPVMKIHRLILAAILLAAVGSEAAHVHAFGPQAIGRWNLPSTYLQYLGCCYGPGHHAPMVRVPCYHPPRQQRFVYLQTPCQNSTPVYCETGQYCAAPQNYQNWQQPAYVPQQLPAQPMNQQVPTYAPIPAQSYPTPELIQPGSSAQMPVYQQRPALSRQPIQRRF